jgi:hypothetical protein
LSEDDAKNTTSTTKGGKGHDDKESAAHLIDPRANPTPVDRASESIMSSQVDKLERDFKADPPKQTSAVSSGQIEIGGPESLINEDAPPHSSSPAASMPPNSTLIANAMGRNQKMPLRTIVGISAGIVVALIALALLLFR